MLMDCTCGVGIEGKLDVTADKVICMDCGEEIQTTSFAKIAMKSQHDVISRKEVKLPPNGLQATCDNEKCNREFSAELNEKTDEVHCPFCGHETAISIIAKGQLRANRVFLDTTDDLINGQGKEAMTQEEYEQKEALKNGKKVAKKKEAPKAKKKPTVEVRMLDPEPEIDPVGEFDAKSDVKRELSPPRPAGFRIITED